MFEYPSSRLPLGNTLAYAPCGAPYFNHSGPGVPRCYTLGYTPPPLRGAEDLPDTTLAPTD